MAGNSLIAKPKGEKQSAGKFSCLNWEFWPWQAVYIPVFAYWVLLGIKNRNLKFPASVNPDMEVGGMFGNSKYRQLAKLPDQFKPRTLFFDESSQTHDVLRALENQSFEFPLIIKPDKVQRGKGVVKVNDSEELPDLIPHYKASFIIQEFVDLPFEAGVFFYRFPGEKKGRIPSLVVKEFLKVKGDGVQPIRELLRENPRGNMVLEDLEKRYGSWLDHIPEQGKEEIVEPIGNHNRGTAFLDGNHLINDQMRAIFDELADYLGEFYYGRFDIKASSPEDLTTGKNLKILEINGANAEPAHIYHPGYSLWNAWKTLFKHWNILDKIYRANLKRGHNPPSWRELRYHKQEWDKAKKGATHT